MQKLTARSIRTVQVLVEALALLGLVIAWLIFASQQFFAAVSKRARLTILTETVQLPELADFGLKLHAE